MKEKVQIISDKFVDFAGKTHYFVVAAVSKEVDDDKYKKELRIGISICHPEDKFDKEIGVLKAVANSKSSKYKIYSSYTGLINTKMVTAILVQEADYIKKYPNRYIKGYTDAELRYKRNLEMEEKFKNFSKFEQLVLVSLRDNPKCLEDVLNYRNWEINQGIEKQI